MKFRKLFFSLLLILAAALIAMPAFSSCGKPLPGDRAGGRPDERENFNPELFPAYLKSVGGSKWGYIDITGTFVIKPVYTLAYDFQENGLAVVQVTGQEGVINTSGEYVIKPSYEFIEPFSEGLAAAYKNGEYHVLDDKGNVVFTTKGHAGRFKEGRAVFSQADKNGLWLYGYIDRYGNVVIEPQYEAAGDFNASRAVVRLKSGEYALIDPDGNIKAKFPHDYVGNLSDGLMAFREKPESLTGYIKEDSKTAIGPAFSYGGTFSLGRAVVNASPDYYLNRYGLIDMKGKYVLKPVYNDVLDLGEGMYAAGIPVNSDNPFAGSKYALADRTGKILTGFYLYGVSGYNNGITSASDGDRTFFLDKKGVKVPALPQVEGMGAMRAYSDIVKADVDQRLSYISKTGGIIWKSPGEIILNDKFSVKEAKYRPNRNYTEYYPQLAGISNKQAQEEINKKLRQLAVPKEISGSEELSYNYRGDFDVEFFRKQLVVLKITGYEYPFGAAHGMPVMTYAHLDLNRAVLYQLKDLFRKNSKFTDRLSRIVRQEIAAKGGQMGVWADSYSGVKENQPFYITGDALKLYFLPYEIAPYAAGFPTFTIPFKSIMDIIDTGGDFWKSFN